MEIKIKAPDAETPGFLRRARQATVFAERLKSGPTPQLFDEMVAFLLPFVVEPEGRDEACEALWNASGKQFTDIMEALVGGGASGSLPPESTTL